MTYKEMQERKKELKLTYEDISKLCGVPVPTLQKIISGTTENPGMFNRAAIESVLRDPDEPFMLKETPFVYGEKRQGQYTADDYYALPDSQRWELIDGVLYYMSSASFNHQIMAGELTSVFKEYVRKNNGTCLVIGVPLDTKIARDNRTVVQPDVMVICDREKIRKWGIFGAPDLAVEVLSPSTRSKDCRIKYAKYQACGVREYWIVDLEKETVVTYDLTQDPVQPGVYGFNSKVPVGIWDGQCVVDLAAIKDQLIEFGED